MAESSAVETVEIQFDQPRRLLFNFRALRALDRVMGEVGIQRSLELLHALNFTTLERALWAGMLHEEPNLTVDNVKRRLEKFINDGGEAGPLFTSAYQAINESRVFTKPGANQGNEQPEPATSA